MATTIPFSYLPTFSDVLLGYAKASDIGLCFTEKLITMTTTLRRGSVLDISGVEVSTENGPDSTYVLVTLPGANGKEGIPNGTQFMAVLAKWGCTLAERYLYLTDGEITEEAIQALELRGLKITDHVVSDGDAQGQVIPDPIPDINLMNSELDERIVYTNPSPHFYWRLDGSLTSAAPNVWPLEYDSETGQVLGRHESEPSATNIVPYSMGTVIDQTNWNSNVPETIGVTTGPTGENVARMPSAFSQIALYKDNPTPAGFIVGPNNALPSTTKWMRHIMQSSGVSNIRIYVGRQDSTPTNHLHIKVPVPDTGLYTTSFYRLLIENSAFIAVGLVQMESGTLATSPIVNSGTSPVTRSESRITITRPERAASFIISYSDGSSESYTFSEDSTNFVLPHAPNNWGKRFIQNISFVAE